MPLARSSASRRDHSAASHNSKWLPIPKSMTSRTNPAALRSSGEIKMRPDPSISTSCALPSSRRCNERADMGKVAICVRRCSQTVRGYTSRQPSGWRVRVKRPSTCEISASRCRVGIETLPFASNVSALLPWNKLFPHFFAQNPTFSHSTGSKASGQALSCSFSNHNKHLGPQLRGSYKKIHREIKKLQIDLQVLCKPQQRNERESKRFGGGYPVFFASSPSRYRDHVTDDPRDPEITLARNRRATRGPEIVDNELPGVAPEKAGQIYRPDSVHQANLVGNHSSGCGIATAL